MKKPLPRRTMLRGMGAAIGLPLLDAMVPAARASTPRGPTRLAVLYVSNGIHMPEWTPAIPTRSKPSILVSPMPSAFPIRLSRALEPNWYLPDMRPWISATEPLRTGRYGKTLVFTLSTTSP